MQCTSNRLFLSCFTWVVVGAVTKHVGLSRVASENSEVEYFCTCNKVLYLSFCGGVVLFVLV